MKFTQLLLESYNRLNEQEGGQDVMSFLMGNAPGSWDPKSGLPKPADVPVNSPGDPSLEPVNVGFNNNGQIVVRGGTLGTQTVNTVKGPGANALAKLEKWYAAGDGSEEEGGGGTGDPILDALSAPDLERVTKLEEVFPGMIKNLKTIYENSKGLEVSDAKLLQKVFGGTTRGSLTSLIYQEIGKGKGAFREKGESFVGFAFDDELKLEDLNASFDAMAQFSDAYAKSSNCEKLDTDTKERVAHNVVKDPEHNTFFFKNFYNFNDVGVSLSVADGNPLNMMAQEYSKNLKLCNENNEEPEDANAIPEKKIHSSTAGNATNISNIVKDVSEIGAVAFHNIWEGGRLGGALGAAKTKEGIELVRGLLMTYGDDAFSYINLTEQIQSGDRMINDQYTQVIEAFQNIGITDDSSVFTAIRNFGEGYFKKSLHYYNKLQPDFAVRVGGYAAKGDKSDVDYVRKEEPIKPLPKGSVVHHVKFSELSKEAQEAITKAGGPIQEKYYLIKDSLKMYQKRGNTKMGTGSDSGLEASRLTDSEDPHGKYVWDKLRPKGKLSASQEKAWNKQMEAGQKKLEAVTTITNKIETLMGGEFRTGTMSAKDAKVFIADQFQAMAETMDDTERKAFNTAMDISNRMLPKNAYKQSKIVKLMLDKYKEGFKDGKNTKRSSEHVTSMMKKIFTDYELKKDIAYKEVKGKSVPDKSNEGTMASFTAIGALMASTGMDSTGIEPQSTIHIVSTGETFRHNQNKIIGDPILDLLDPKNDRSLQANVSSYVIDNDGNLTSSAGRGGKASYDMYVNTTHLTPDEE